MSDEIMAFLKHGTWTLVPKPNSGNVVCNRWVYCLKRKANRSIDRCKTRLVVKSFKQWEGVNYTKTFSPVIKATTLRTDLALSISKGWALCQLDVSNTFLHGNLIKDVYMTQPQGFIDKEHPEFVCKLWKSLYKLK